jgi:hypothetical protein
MLDDMRYKMELVMGVDCGVIHDAAKELEGALERAIEVKLNFLGFCAVHLTP